MSRKPFDQYIQETTGKAVGDSGFSPSLLAFLKSAHELGADLKSALEAKSEAKAHQLANASLRLGHRVQYHGIGKNPGKRYYHFAASELNPIPDWQIVEQYLIPHFYAIKKDETNISNVTIAKKVGWISMDESDSEILRAAERRSADALRVLKDVRKTVTVEQKHRAGLSGSFHTITADWMEIINLYSEYDPDREMTIRERKGIRYRIFSLIRTAAGAFSEAFRRLLVKQRTKWLRGLVTMDPEILRQNRILLKSFAQGVDGNSFAEYDAMVDDPARSVPDLDMSEGGISFLYAKTPKAYTLLLDLVEPFAQRFGMNRTLIIRRDYQKQYMHS